MLSIEIDEDVFSYLQAKAQPFLDTPNTVLRRELLAHEQSPTLHRSLPADQARRASARSSAPISLPGLPFGTPAALQQTLWVMHLVLSNGRARSEATADVATMLSVTPQTVLDKYCRQLGLTAGRFDLLLRGPDLKQLETLLVTKYSEHAKTILQFLREHRGAE
jgi:hypothetical protein